MKKTLSILLFSVVTILNTYSQENQIPLWNNIPNSIQNKEYKEELKLDKNGERIGIKKVTTPTIIPYLTDNQSDKKPAVIICPGGGYSALAFDKEGILIAKYFNSIGVSAFVLKYRLPSAKIMQNKTIAPLQDAQEAIRLVRRNAQKWNIDATKIGVIGFSAGGHLASTVSTHYNDIVYESDTTSARPDFSILIYPVISMENGITHNGSKINLIGKNPSQELITKYSNEKSIDANTPPTFLIHATDDLVVPVENSIQYYLALKKNRVPVEMHIYENGGHGFGLGTNGTHLYWPESLKKWLTVNKLID